MITTITPRLLIEECARQGLQSGKLLQEVGIARSDIGHSSRYISIDKMYRLWSKVTECTGDPMLGLHVAEKVPFGAYSLVDHMAAASSTPGEALLRTASSFGVVNSAFVLTIDFFKDAAFIDLTSPQDPCGPPRAYVEYIFASLLVRFAFTTGIRWRPAEVQVTYQEQNTAREYQRIFEAPVRYNQKTNRLIMPRGLMELHHATADPEICELLEDYAKRKLRGIVPSRNLLNNLQLALEEALTCGKVDLASVSRKLAISRRSLQREILANGTTFRDVLESVRRRHAYAMLEDSGMPVSEIAFKLCFADAASFTRAFHRWTGVSPQTYRKSIAQKDTADLFR